MAQGVLAFKYEEEKGRGGMTALGGLPAYVELAHVLGLGESIRRHLKVRGGGQGWTDAQVVTALVLLNLAGGECVDDLKVLEGDEGFCRLLRRVETHGMKRRERREIERRWRKERKRVVPSQSSVFRYLSGFHNKEEEAKRKPHQAFIPEANDHLKGLGWVSGDMVSGIQKRSPEREATLDMDGTLVETSKKEALYSYKGMSAYQPVSVWWEEQQLILHSEFRDGNVPAGYENLRLLEEALDRLPSGVEKVSVRTDTAGYQQDILKYCGEGRSQRFGVIELAIGVDVTEAFKKAVSETAEEDWKPLRREVKGKWQETGQEWAEVCYVPEWAGRSKKGPDYRYLAIREPLAQREFTGMEAQLPFPTMTFTGKGRYKLFGTITNRTIPGDELIGWHRGRCGKSEEAHSVMKEDLAGGKLPSGKFGENAAWWAMVVLAFNLNSAMKRLVLGEKWVSKRLKAIRFALIHVAGRVIEGSRQFIIRLSPSHPATELLLDARRKILELAHSPLG
jgi:hypothetical protein